MDLKKIFGSDARELKRLEKIANMVEALEPSMQALSDSELQAKTDEFRRRYKLGATLDELLPEAFAAVREAFVRTLGKRPFHVQIIGGIVLHQGRIAEMKTGEGKTFVAVLPAYLNAITGKGVHIVTVNDYLADYQGKLMSRVLNFMNMSVGIVVNGLTPEERIAAYNSDVTYGANNEFGFDYLRDNMVLYKSDLVQRELNFAIVDEVDSILIDEARTPLIISGQGDKSTDLYKSADMFVRRLKGKLVTESDTHSGLDAMLDKAAIERLEQDDDVNFDYIAYEKERTVNLTARGVAAAEAFFGLENLADPDNATIAHHINNALKAHSLMKRDVAYVIKDGEIMIVDEFTGRMMPGRRYSEGLHQAIEAKEHVEVRRESKTLATITYQNYFRMYGKLSGMTGTAKTEEDEFRSIYALDVVVIPTNMPMIRVDENDAIFLNEKTKFEAVVEEIRKAHESGQPLLVGTISIEKSEYLSAKLKKAGIAHNVLNAKYHKQEAEIIAQAGRFGAVTIATNMAGRGTDIILGGNPELLVKAELAKRGLKEDAVAAADTLHTAADDEQAYKFDENRATPEELEEARQLYRELLPEYERRAAEEREKVVAAGGLFVIGTERHESRRIDNQLRGRSGRQGDPGRSKFFVSLTDDLMRLFGGDKITGLVNRIGGPEALEMESMQLGILTKQIESAQKRVEARNFGIRKHVLEYDDVMNVQRGIIYRQRRQVLDGEDVKHYIMDMLDTICTEAAATFSGSSELPDEWNYTGLRAYLSELFPTGALGNAFLYTNDELDDMTVEKLAASIKSMAVDLYEAKEREVGAELMRILERKILLRVVDDRWMEHIDNMMELRQGVGLNAIAQRDPVTEYKIQGYDMFEEMVASIRTETLRQLYHVVKTVREVKRREEAKRFAAMSFSSSKNEGVPVKKQPVKRSATPGPNSPCPCGSGKKYKNCCGRNNGETK